MEGVAGLRPAGELSAPRALRPPPPSALLDFLRSMAPRSIGCPGISDAPNLGLLPCFLHVAQMKNTSWLSSGCAVHPLPGPLPEPCSLLMSDLYSLLPARLGGWETRCRAQVLAAPGALGQVSLNHSSRCSTAQGV